MCERNTNYSFCLLSYTGRPHYTSMRIQFCRECKYLLFADPSVQDHIGEIAYRDAILSELRYNLNHNKRDGKHQAVITITLDYHIGEYRSMTSHAQIALITGASYTRWALSPLKAISQHYWFIPLVNWITFDPIWFPTYSPLQERSLICMGGLCRGIARRQREESSERGERETEVSGVRERKREGEPWLARWGDSSFYTVQYVWDTGLC